MNEIVEWSPHAIARAAMSWPFDPMEIARFAERDDVVEAIEGFERALRPAKEIPLDQRQEETRKLANIIGSIGLRVRPDFSQEQAQLWSAEVVDALSNLPLRAAIAGARDAKHEPIRFPGEVHPAIARLTEPHISAYRNALSNLRRLLREIDDPTHPVKRKHIPDISDDDLQNLPAPLRAMGIGAGWLIEENGRLRWATDAEQAEHERRIARAREGDRS